MQELGHVSQLSIMQGVGDVSQNRLLTRMNDGESEKKMECSEEQITPNKRKALNTIILESPIKRMSLDGELTQSIASQSSTTTDDKLCSESLELSDHFEDSTHLEKVCQACKKKQSDHFWTKQIRCLMPAIFFT